MMKRIIALTMVFALLLGLCACSRANSIESILTTGAWTGGHNIGLRFYSDGTGIQYRLDDGGLKFKFRWTVSGKILSVIEEDDEEDYCADEEEYIMKYEILEYSRYVIDLRENGDSYSEFSLHRTNINDR